MKPCKSGTQCRLLQPEQPVAVLRARSVGGCDDVDLQRYGEGRDDQLLKHQAVGRIAGSPANASSTSSSSSSVSSSGSPASNKVVALLQRKISRTMRLIRSEQSSRDDNVNEYFKLTAGADKQQQARIKAVFEKKYQKSAMSIAQLQRKLEDYHKRLRMLGPPAAPESSSAVTASRPLLIKSGSALDLRHLGGKQPDHDLPTGSRALVEQQKTDAANSILDQSECAAAESGVPGDHLSDQSKADEEEVVPTFALMPSSGWSPRQPRKSHLSPEWETAVMQELALQKQEQERLRQQLVDMKQQLELQLDALGVRMRDERDKCERLEEQLNDMTELHQHQMQNLRSGLHDMEEKVQYQSQERLLDIREHLQSLDTKLSSMEHQQSEQQYLRIEGLDTRDARAILMKLLTVTITLIHVLLFVAGALLSLVKPLVSTMSRMLVSSLVLLACVLLYQRQELLLRVWPKLST